MKKKPYQMQIGLNALNHLGINLYSNIPSVLAEVVANSWDADSEEVIIQINTDEGVITITDDGHGMTEQEINERFLFVGFERRKNQSAITPKHKRPVMGRKGIGKLSLFSIAEKIEVQSIKDSKKNRFQMVLEDIKKAIEKSDSTYYPLPLDNKSVRLKKGTKIILTGLKKRLIQTEAALKKRLARRFSIIGKKQKFAISLNGQTIGLEDRDYFCKLQYLWHFGEDGSKYEKLCEKMEFGENRKSEFISGWIGSVKEVGALKDDKENLNKISIMVRGKLAQEDILESFGEGGMYSSYLIGEIHADFLDEDQSEDIATSSRQAIFEEDDRFIALRKFLRKELKHIQSKWTDLRTESGTKKALEIPEVKTWYGELSKDHRKSAESLLGRINQLTLNFEEDRVELIKHGVLAFESLKYRENLDALDGISAENLPVLARIIGNLDDMEATLYHQIIKGRINVVKVFQEKVEDNVLERAIQQHLFNHLWLLDPSWERATSTEYMERKVSTEFGKIDAALTKKEKDARIDLKYRTTSGKHVIIELKRSNILLSTDDLMPQIRKYRTTLKKILKEIGQENDSIEIVCVVGKELKDWKESNGEKESINQFKELDARVVLYEKLLKNAYQAYQEYLDKGEEAGRIFKLISSIESSMIK